MKTLSKFLLFAGLLLASLQPTVAQLLPVSSLPTVDPAIPSAPTASSSKADQARWLWGNYWYQVAQKGRAQVTADNITIGTLNGKVTALSDSIASLGSGGTGGASSADITAIKSGIATLDTKINSLTSTAAFIASWLPAVSGTKAVVSATSTGGAPSQLTVSWDYNAPRANVTGYRVELSMNGVDFALIGTTPDANTLTFVDKGLSVPIAVGTTRWYRVKAYSLSLAVDSDYSNTASRSL